MAKIIVKKSNNVVTVCLDNDQELTLTNTECSYVKSSGIKTTAIDLGTKIFEVT